MWGHHGDNRPSGTQRTHPAQSLACPADNNHGESANVQVQV